MWGRKNFKNSRPIRWYTNNKKLTWVLTFQNEIEYEYDLSILQLICRLPVITSHTHDSKSYILYLNKKSQGYGNISGLKIEKSHCHSISAFNPIQESLIKSAIINLSENIFQIQLSTQALIRTFIALHYLYDLHIICDHLFRLCHHRAECRDTSGT